MLAVLAANPGRLVTKEQLIEAVWPDTAVEESNLTYHIFAIRKALGEAPDGEKYIETVPRKGYRFAAPLATEAAAPVVAPAAPRSRRLILAVAALLALAAVGLRLASLAVVTQSRAVSDHFQDPVTGRLAESGMFAVSPDGQRLVFAAEGADGVMRLWLRTMSALEPVALQGTEVFTIVPPMIWSPDSRFIAYDATGILKKAGVDGGTPQTICQLPGTAVGGSWNARGDILGNAFGGLVWCHAGGGAAAVVSTVNAAEQEIHLVPSFLSDGRHFIYLHISRSETGNIGGLPRRARPAGRQLRPRARSMTPRESPLITTGFGATFVPGQSGEPSLIVFARDGALFGQPFDERRLALDGEPIRIAEHVGSYLDTAFFSASPATLVYRAPEPDFRLTWFDRRGVELGRVGTPALVYRVGTFTERRSGAGLDARAAGDGRPGSLAVRPGSQRGAAAHDVRADDRTLAAVDERQRVCVRIAWRAVWRVSPVGGRQLRTCSSRAAGRSFRPAPHSEAVSSSTRHCATRHWAPTSG